MRPVRARRDPAPSRSAYRLQRLWLTPGIRHFLKWGLPLCALGLVLGLWAADPARRLAVVEWSQDLRHQIEQRPEFLVNLMAIEGASDAVARELRETLPLDFPVSSFDLDLEAIRTQCEALDAVASAGVRILAGGILELTVTERSPVALWRSPEGLFLVDAEGYRIASLEHRSERPDLPLLAGEGADAEVSEALDLLATAAPLLPRIRGLLRVGERRWDVVLDRDQRILLPEAGAHQALERVIALDQVRDLLDRDLVAVDMRNPERPTFRMGPGAAELFRQSRLARTE